MAPRIDKQVFVMAYIHQAYWWAWKLIGLDADGSMEARAPFTQDEGTPESVYYSVGR